MGRPLDGLFFFFFFFFFSGLITIEVERAVMNGWVRSFHSDAPEGMNGLLDGSCLD